MQCVILAGGVGTRMRPITDSIPKAMIPVLGKPFAHYQLAWLASEGVKQVVYCVGHKGQMIKNYVQDGHCWNLSVTYVDDGPTLRGTAGALRLAFDEGVLDESFFVLYGDSFLPIHLDPVRKSFFDSRSPALMTVFRNQGRWDTSNVLYRNGRVLLYDKSRRDARSAQMEHIDYGLSVLSKEIVGTRMASGVSFDLADLQRQLSMEGALAGFEVSERFYEIGSPSGLRDFENYLSSRGQQ